MWLGVPTPCRHCICTPALLSGRPKGVAVSKRRWRSDSLACPFSGQSSPTVASYMALAHGADRGLCWQAVLTGARIGFVREYPKASFWRDVRGVRPTLFLGMSHFWAELFAEYNAQLEQLVLEGMEPWIQEWSAAEDGEACPFCVHSCTCGNPRPTAQSLRAAHVGSPKNRDHPPRRGGRGGAGRGVLIGHFHRLVPPYGSRRTGVPTSDLRCFGPAACQTPAPPTR